MILYFFAKIVKGGADKSYGIQVAKLAGVPDSVIERAKELVEELSAMRTSRNVARNIMPSIRASKKKTKPKNYDEVDLEQMSLFDTVRDDDILKELQEMWMSAI